MTSNDSEAVIAALEALAASGPMCLADVLSAANGENLEEVRRLRAMADEAYDAGKPYECLPPDRWPQIGDINWDCRPQSQRFSLDGKTEKDFGEAYPQGLALGHVDRQAFDERLCHHSRRDGDELWKVGDCRKLVKALGWIILAFPMSPPLVAPIGSDEIIFHGGHHRYAVAKAYGMSEIPILVAPADVTAVEARIPVRWV